MKLMDHFSLSPLAEMTLRSGDTELSLTKTRKNTNSAVSSQETVVVEEEPPMISTFPSPKKKNSTENASSADTEIITSPIVGIFYRSPAPDAPPFVMERTSVKTGDPLGIIEAMKVMNKLEAEFEMRVIRIIAENGGMVEYGTPLFEVQKL